MARTAGGDIQYVQDAQAGVYRQTAPAVCEGCEHPLTRATYGWSYSQREANGYHYEILLCVRCTAERAGRWQREEHISYHGLL